MHRRQFMAAAGALAAWPLVGRTQSLPAFVDLTPYYTIPQRTWGDTIGDCVAVSLCYAMEMRNILQGGTPIQLSELYCAVTGGYYGVCRESLWPFSLTFPSAAIPDPYQAQQNAIHTSPSAAAIADSQNFTAVTEESWPVTGEVDCLLRAKASISSGYPIRLWVPPDHVQCFWGFDDSIRCFLGFDNRATSPGVSQFDYGIAASVNSVFSYISSVSFNITTLSGNSQMLTDIISIAQTALAAGNVTQAQKDALTVDVAALTVSAGSPQILVPPAAFVTDPSGAVWSLGTATQYGFQTLRNGMPFASGQATVISLKNGQIKVQNSLGNWYLAGSNSWSATSAP